MDRPDRWGLRIARRIAALSGALPPRSDDSTDAIAVRAAVASLPPRQRATVVLRYFNDLSVTDTAVILACAEGTVKALTSQAIANLRRQFGDVLAHDEELPDA
jgi:DNA-directed RNA polymerase specialized sigma24 family protein